MVPLAGATRGRSQRGVRGRAARGGRARIGTARGGNEPGDRRGRRRSDPLRAAVLHDRRPHAQGGLRRARHGQAAAAGAVAVLAARAAGHAGAAGVPRRCGRRARGARVGARAGAARGRARGARARPADRLAAAGGELGAGPRGAGGAPPASGAVVRQTPLLAGIGSGGSGCLELHRRRVAPRTRTAGPQAGIDLAADTLAARYAPPIESRHVDRGDPGRRDRGRAGLRGSDRLPRGR